MSQSLKVLQTFRPSFLILTPVCLFLAAAFAHAQGISFALTSLIIIFLAALLAHIAVNTLNEYQDFTSGLDLLTKRTPFSGGSGTLPNNPQLAATTLVLGVVSVLLIVILGGYLAYQTTFALIPFGLIGLAIVITYTKWLNRSPWLCLIAPGTGFGIIMVVGR
ncbi:prenyltransferase [Colwellia sp. MEBiC06753]